jgi:chromate transporter
MTLALKLFLTFAALSPLAFGGGNTILPEMQRQVVSVHHWLSASDFVVLYALAQAAPGPNMLVATLIGWRVAGLGGALAATFGLCLPSSLLTFAIAGLWWRFREASWRRWIQAALVPVTVGLVGAGAAVIAAETARGPLAAVITALVALLTLATRANPLWFLAAGALAGVVGRV